MRAEEHLGNNAITVDAGDPVSSVIGKMVEAGVPEAFVFEGETYLGAFSYPRFLKSRIDASSAKAGNFIRRTASIQAEMDMSDVRRIIQESDLDVLPVFSDGEYSGTITVLDCMEQPEKIVKQKIDPVEHDAPIREVIHRMHSGKREIPVAENGDVTGVIDHLTMLERYYLRAVPEHARRQRSNTTRTREFEPEKKSILDLPAKNLARAVDILPANLQAVMDAMHDAGVFMVYVRHRGEVFAVHARDLIQHEDESKGHVSFVGLSDCMLDGQQDRRMREVARDEAGKLSAHVGSPFDVVVQCKAFQQKGTRHRYEMHARVAAPHIIQASAAESWDPVAALHETLQSLQQALRKK